VPTMGVVWLAWDDSEEEGLELGIEMGWTLEAGEEPGHLNELVRPVRLPVKLD